MPKNKNGQVTPNLSGELLQELVRKLDGEDVYSIVLFGSHASGQATEFSDFDIGCFLKSEQTLRPQREIFYQQEKLVVVDCITPAQARLRIRLPELLVVYNQGILQGKSLIDKENYFLQLQQIAKKFEWNVLIQEKANLWVNNQFLTLVEYIHKTLASLKNRDEAGKMFFVRQLIPLTTLRIIQVKFGIMVKSENEILGKVKTFLRLRGNNNWIDYFEKSTGHNLKVCLEEQVQASLHLFFETYTLLEETISERNRLILGKTISLIKQNEQLTILI